GFLRLSVRLRLPTFSPSYIGAPSRPCGLPGPTAIVRKKSGRDFDSMRRTVAPCSTKYRVAIGPAAPDPNSKILSPPQARSSADRVDGFGRPGAANGPRGWGRGGAGSPSALRITQNARGNRSTSPTGPKNARDASCADA